MTTKTSTAFTTVIEIIFSVFLAIFVAFFAIFIAVAWEVYQQLRGGPAGVHVSYLVAIGLVFVATVLYIARRLDDWIRLT